MMVPYTDIDDINGHIRYPLPPTAFGKWAQEMDIYVRFMRQIRASACSRSVIRILTALQVAAAGAHHSDEDAAVILVDLGLRAPREAFPAAFLDRIDQAQARRGRAAGLSHALTELTRHWDEIENSVWARGDKPSFILGATPLIMAVRSDFHDPHLDPP